MRPPVSGGARWYETVTQWLDDHFILLLLDVVKEWSFFTENLKSPFQKLLLYFNRPCVVATINQFPTTTTTTYFSSGDAP